MNLKLRSKKQKLKLKVINRIQYPPQYCFKPHFNFAPSSSRTNKQAIVSKESTDIFTKKLVTRQDEWLTNPTERSLLKLRNLCFFDNRKEFLDVHIALGRKQQQ